MGITQGHACSKEMYRPKQSHLLSAEDPQQHGPGQKCFYLPLQWKIYFYSALAQCYPHILLIQCSSLLTLKSSSILGQPTLVITQPDTSPRNSRSKTWELNTIIQVDTFITARKGQGLLWLKQVLQHFPCPLQASCKDRRWKE